MSYDIVADDLTDAECSYLERVRPELVAGHYTYCPTCSKMGKYHWQGIEVVCDCARQLALAQRYTLAGIPDNYQKLDWSDYAFAMPAGVEDYRAHLEPFAARGLGLLLIGPKGVGKTMLATLMLKEFIKRGMKGFSILFSEVTDQITAGWGSGDKARAAQESFDDRFTHTDVLLLDDLGKEWSSANTMAKVHFDNILRRRVQNNRVTLLTSNLGVDGLVSNYGEGVLSLLKEKSMAVPIVGQDFRDGLAVRLAEEGRTNQTRAIV